MAEKQYSLMELKSIIKDLDEIADRYRTGSYSVMDMSGIIMLASEHIADKCIRDHENQQTFSGMSAKLVQDLTIRQRISEKRYNEWFENASHSVKVGLLLMMADPDTDCTCDAELANMLVDFCAGETLTDVTAHYFAATLLGAFDPQRSYDMIISDFGKYPQMLDTLYNGCGYIFDPKQSQDYISHICPICSGNKSEPFYCANQAAHKDPCFSPAKLWMRCSSCNNLYSYNYPIKKCGEINKNYGETVGGKIRFSYHPSIYSDIFNNIRAINRGSKYLEVGIGNGEMFACAMEMGYEADAFNISCDDCENVSSLLGADVTCGDFLDFNTSKKYDVIVMDDVIERVSEPVSVLRRAYDLLAEGGVLWISAPNFESAYTRFNGFNDPMWNQKEYFTYFSYSGIKPILTKIGFEVKRYDISKRYSGSMELILQKM